MSVVAGVLRFDGARPRQADIKRQINTMRHAGPDRRRIWCNGPVGLGHGLLRATQEDAFDNQPIVDDGIAVVADVRLDNREDLASALNTDPDALATLPDSALIAASYTKWGEDCASHLLGDFAFAVWDGSAQKLVLGRDHMGTRYIHYHRGEDFFAFSTQLKGLWALADVPRRLDDTQFGKDLREYIFDTDAVAGRTGFVGIAGIPGGTVMRVGVDGTIASRRYWTPAPDPVHLGRDDAYYIATYRKLVEEAVQCRIRRAVKPVGLSLSGGMDSSAIAALAGPVMRAKGQKLIAVGSVLPEGSAVSPLDARPWVEACARHMPHLDVRYVTRESSRWLDRLEETFLRTDTGSSVNRLSNEAIHQAFAQAGVRVILDGHGGDVTVNRTGNGWLARQFLQGRLSTFVNEVFACKKARGVSLWTVVRQEVLAPMVPPWLKPLIDRCRGRGSLYESLVPWAEARGGTRRFAAVDNTRNADAIWSALLAFLQNSPACAGHVGALAHGLEYTQPYHDKRLVEFALAIPERLLVRDGRDRFLARAALADILPREVLERPRKGRDDRIPDLAEAVARERADLFGEIEGMEANPRLRGIFDFAKMRHMLRAPRGESRRLSDMRLARAVSAFMRARFIAWFERDNRPPAEDERPAA